MITAIVDFVHTLILWAPFCAALIIFPAGYLSVASWECERAERKAAAKSR